MKKSFVLFIITILSSAISIAQSSGTFPGEPFNGMQVNYNITGATVTKYTDVPGFTWTRSLVITDIQKGGVLGISGSLQAGGLGCTVIISVSAGGKPSSGTYEVKPGTPMNFQQQVTIPKDAKSASISINMNGHYSMGGGSRGVIVRGDWDGRWGSVTKPAEPDKHKPAASAVAVLKDILKIYSDESKIPRGLVSNGTDNNKLWWFDKKYDDYVCGAYQSKVLGLLDNIKYGNNPAQKKLLEGYEYGPIQANCGVTPGGHQAVVIYPKGTDWRVTGTVLDPWPEQKSKSYTMEEWKKIFPYGVNPSGYYKGQYPICGGSGYNDPRKTELTPAENNWYKSLTKKGQEVYTKIKDVTERKRRMKIDYSNRQNDTRTAADCPLNLYITDAAGRITGFPGGKLRTEIPGVSVNTFQLSDGTYWTELAYPANKGFMIILKGTGRGSAEVYSGFNMQDDVESRSVYKYSFQVNNGQEYALDQQQENTAIKIMNASKTKKAEISGARITSNNDDGGVIINSGQEKKIFDNGNIYGVTNGPISPTQFILTQATFITRIENYHYFNNGRLPGTITLVNSKGQQFGPWYATGTAGQGGVQNAYWVVRPNITLPAGTYSVIDSDPATWSTNAQSANKGFTTVWAAGQQTP
jgi:hypothetical protein